MSIGVLFVCLGNICRSPLAEGIFSSLVKERKLENHFKIDSCGTAAYHLGLSPHPITRRVAEQRGIILDSKARQFQTNDFNDFDYILAMDRSNYKDLLGLSSCESEKEKVILFRKFDPNLKEGGVILDVPDPFYGGDQGFEKVHEIVMQANTILLEELIQEYKL